MSIDFANKADEGKYSLFSGATVCSDGTTRALRIDKDGPHARIPLDINPSQMPTCTLEVWVKLESIANKQGWLLGNERTGYDRTILMHDSRFGGGVALAVGYAYKTSHGPPKLHQWLHVVAIFSQGKGSYVYVDGVRSEGVVAKNRPSGAMTELWLGRPHHGNHFVDCWVRAVRVYDCALPDEAVQDLYKRGIPGIQKP